MTPWQLIDAAEIPGDGEHMRLYRRGNEFSIQLKSGELMNSRLHGSEDALADHACGRVAARPGARILIGGLGMGFTLAAALRRLGADATVVVAELMPAVVVWNRGPLAELAGAPLLDPRVEVREADVAAVLKGSPAGYDAVLLDVDNGPEGLTRRENDRLYDLEGLETARAALRPGGVLAVWSAGPDAGFADRLRLVGFVVEELRVRARGDGKRGGARHTIWVAG